MKYYNIKETSARIRELRIRKGHTQKAAAGLLNIDRSSLSNIENGAKPCSIDLLIRLSEIYGVSLDYLVLGRDVDGRATKERLRALIEALSALMESLDAGEVSN